MWHGARLMVVFGLECARRGMPKGYLEHDRSVDVEPVRWDFDARVLEAAVGERFAAFEAGQVVVDVPSMSSHLPIRSTRHGGISRRGLTLIARNLYPSWSTTGSHSKSTCSPTTRALIPPPMLKLSPGRALMTSSGCRAL